MEPLDGHYRHRGAVITWDDAGVTLSHLGQQQSATATWGQIDGARQIGERPGYVQLIVRGHVPPAELRRDPFAIAVNSDPDANRLVTTISWRAAAERAAGSSVGESGHRGDDGDVGSWFRQRTRRG